MTDLIACISEEPKFFNHIKKVIEDENWENIFLVAKKKFNNNINKKFEWIIIDEKNSLPEMVVEIKNKLKGKIKGLDVALNLICGDGKEHMAIISAIIQLGFGIRLVALTKEGIREV